MQKPFHRFLSTILPCPIAQGSLVIHVAAHHARGEGVALAIESGKAYIEWTAGGASWVPASEIIAVAEPAPRDKTPA
jgi:hypothetical protein